MKAAAPAVRDVVKSYSPKPLKLFKGFTITLYNEFIFLK
jgi:hypothetical protein